MSMMKKPTISILIPAYNEAECIHTCLQSILVQEEKLYTIKEIIVISDGSTDTTAQVVQTFNHPLVTLIEHRQNLGVQTRLNEGFQKAKGDYLFKIDGDLSLLNSKSLDKILNNLIVNKSGCVLMFCHYKKPESLLQKHAYYWDKVRKNMLKSLSNDYTLWRVTGSYLIQRKIYTSLEIPKDVIEEDQYVPMKALQRGQSISYLTDPVIRGQYPLTWSQLAQQQARYSTRTITEKHFSHSFLQKNLPSLPKKLIIKTLILSCIYTPSNIQYIFTRILVTLLAWHRKKQKPVQRAWYQ